MIKDYRDVRETADLEIRSTALSDLSAVEDLHQEVFPFAPSTRHAAWKQWGSPAGPPLSVHARRREDGQVVAAMTGVRRRVWVDGFRNDALLLCETCARPGARDGGRAYKQVIASAAIRAREESGVYWAYGGQTTDAALRIGARWFGYVHVFTLAPLEVRLSLAPALHRILGHAGDLLAAGVDPLLRPRTKCCPEGWSVRESHDFGREFDGMWELHRQEYRTVVCRDASDLRWRYEENPRWDHRTLVLWCGDTPRGYIIWREWQPDEVKVATIVDFWVGEHDEPADILLASAGRAAAEAGCAFLRFSVKPGSVGERAMRRMHSCRPCTREAPDRIIIGATQEAEPPSEQSQDFVETLSAVLDAEGWYYTPGDADLRD